MARYSIIVFCCSILLSCKEEPSIVLPTVVTGEVTKVGGKTATASGELIAAGDSELIAIGLVAGETPNPTLQNGIFSTITDLNLGVFISQITGLRSNSQYYIRAYATNRAGTAYGLDKMLTTEIVVPTLLEFAPVTEIVGYNFTQAIGFLGSAELHSLFLANRQRERSSGFDYEHLYRYDILTMDTATLFNSKVDLISKEIQIVDNQLVVIGSQYINIYEFDLLQVPDIVANGKRLSRHGSARMNNEIYVYGGDLNGQDSDKIWRWDKISATFTYVATMPTAKSYAAGEIVNEQLYVFGGQKEFAGTLHDDIIYVYSFSENNFQTLHLPQALYRSFTARVGELIYVAGHINPTGNDNTDLFFGVFNTNDSSFIEISINLSDAATASIWALTAIGNNLYVVYGDPVHDIEELSGEQTFTIQKAAIP